jgi:serine/threonine protein kinase
MAGPPSGRQLPGTGDSPGAGGKQALREVGGFELIEKVGQGGMGTVWRARQKSLDRIVALKILPPSIAKDKLFIERFVREARATAKLVHPNVVAGIDVGEDKATGLW